MKKIAFGFSVLISLCTHAQTANIWLFDAKQIPVIRQKLKQNDPLTTRLVNDLVSEGDKIIGMVPGSVMDKAFVSPSHDKHDYMSLAPYFWPDPSKPDSLPYMRKDGQRNPMIDKITDKKNLVDLGHHTLVLSLCYAITGNGKYASKALNYLHVWFTDTATRMNPNLTYAQAVLGVNDGRGIGIIETVALANTVDAIGILENANAVSKNDLDALHHWYEQYLNWMLTSKNGTDERKALNNHGIWYDMQVISFSLFLHKDDAAKQYLANTTLPRIQTQFEPDGKQPLELERTTALGYSTFSLEAWFKTAIMASRLGVDIWNYTTPDGRNIRKALDWLIPFATGQKKWTYQQIKEYTEVDKMYFLLIEAAKRYHDDIYLEDAKKLKVGDVGMIELLYGLR